MWSAGMKLYHDSRTPERYVVSQDFETAVSMFLKHTIEWFGSDDASEYSQTLAEAPEFVRRVPGDEFVTVPMMHIPASLFNDVRSVPDFIDNLYVLLGGTAADFVGVVNPNVVWEIND